MKIFEVFGQRGARDSAKSGAREVILQSQDSNLHRAMFKDSMRSYRLVRAIFKHIQPVAVFFRSDLKFEIPTGAASDV